MFNAIGHMGIAGCKALLILALTFLTATSHAVDTDSVTDDSFTHFNEGVSTGAELLARGVLTIGPRANAIENSGDGVTWDIAVDRYDGSIFFSTGHSGKVYRVNGNAKPELWADLQEIEALSLEIDPKGGLLIGASPGGKIYRVAKKGKPELFFDTKEQHVWDMIVDRDGVLYAATGTNGKIFRIRGERNGEILFDSEATNVMSLALDSEGRLLAGTQGKASILRITSAREAYVVHAPTEDEIRTITVDGNGNIYAALNSSRTSGVFDKNTTSSFGSTLGGNAEIIQVQPGGFTREFWKSPEGPIHAILADPATSSILVAAGKRGKIYRVSIENSDASVAVDVDESLIMSLATHQGRTFFGTANKSAVYELVTTSTAREAEFASRALDGDTTVRWGNIFFEGEVTTGTEATFETRTGNTAEPSDPSWSPWSPAQPVGERIVKSSSPVGRYLQYRIRLKATAEVSPVIDSVKAFYVENNATPVIKRVDVSKASGSSGSSQAAALAAMASRVIPAPSSSSSGSSDAGADAARAASAAASAAQAAAAARSAAAQAGRPELENSQRVNISWDADDPNDDKLRYRVLYKAEDETAWKEAQKNLTTSRHALATGFLPDGAYRVQIEASDSLDNAPRSATTATLASSIFYIDNTPPEILNLGTQRNADGTWTITAAARDATTIIGAADYNLDGSEEWHALVPDDGLFDFTEENFRVTITPEKPAEEHTVIIRVFDLEGNPKVAKALLR